MFQRATNESTEMAYYMVERMLGLVHLLMQNCLLIHAKVPRSCMGSTEYIYIGDKCYYCGALIETLFLPRNKITDKRNTNKQLYISD